MTTAAQDRLLIRQWRDHHSDGQPDRDGHACVRTIWMDDKPIGKCGRVSAWFVDYGPPLGRRPLCEAHTVAYITARGQLEAARREMA